MGAAARAAKRLKVHRCSGCGKEWHEVSIASIDPETKEALCKWCDLKRVARAFDRRLLRKTETN